METLKVHYCKVYKLEARWTGEATLVREEIVYDIENYAKFLGTIAPNWDYLLVFEQCPEPWDDAYDYRESYVGKYFNPDKTDTLTSLEEVEVA